jgi:hypothetical protein
MKASTLIIRIPEPCHEDWNSMLPDAKGKFCNSCNKSVFDFSNKTDTQIRDILMDHKDQKVCGHFKKTQINRPLNISININDLPKNISITRAFAIALFIVFGTFLFSCTDEHGQKVNAIEVVESTGPEDKDIAIGMLLVPPDSLVNTVLFEKGDAINEICTSVSGEMYVDGGMELVEIPEPIIEQINKDSTVEEVPMLDRAVLGGVSYTDYLLPEETIEADSSLLNNSRMEEARIMNKSNKLTVYPNPSGGEFMVSYEVTKRADISLVIYDLKGVLMRSLVNVHGQYEGRYQIPVNLNELPNGIYIVSLINGDKKMTERLVIER